MKELQPAIERGLGFIRRQQLPGGGFTARTSPDRFDFQEAMTSPNVFVSALIGQMLAAVPEARPVCRLIAGFLLEHKNDRGSWNYWQRNTAQPHKPAYPDDLDDTACAWAAIHQADASLFDASAQAQLGRLLIYAEQSPGGPYRTWLVAPNGTDAKWYDIDPAVNANIACLLNQLDITLPALDAFLTETVTSDGPVASPYYPDELTLLYLCSRAGKRLATLVRQRLERADIGDGVQSDFNLLLRVNCLLRAGYAPADLKDQLTRIIRTQLPDGSWPATGFYVESNFGTSLYGGAAALSTALALETLSLADQPTVTRTISNKPGLHSGRSQPAFMAAHRSVAHMPQTELTELFSEALQRLEKRDGDRQIGSIAHHLYSDMAADIPAGIIQRLDQGSVYGWLAYMLYDDILDGEPLAARRLGVANVTARSCVRSFLAALPQSTGFQAFVERSLLTVDVANTWELQYTRVTVDPGGLLYMTQLPDYGDLRQLADRSWGHVLSTVGVLIAAGYRLRSPAVRHWLDFFHHFIIARQLHDDAHDWPDDLRAGRLTAVVCLLLDGRTLPARIDPDQDMSRLKQRFWRRTAPPLIELIDRHITAAGQALDQCAFLVNDRRYRLYLTRLRAGVEQMRRQRDEAEQFISTFSAAG